MDDNGRYFLAIAEHGSINKAAQAFNISQPALSKRLRQEERRLHVELFDRGKSPIKPTAAGEIYLEWAHKSLHSEEQMLRNLSDVSRNRKRRLFVGVSSSRGATILPTVVERFNRETKACSITFLEAPNGETVVNLLTDDKADFVVLTPVKPDGTLFDADCIANERLVLIAPKNLSLPLEGTFEECVIDPGSAGGTFTGPLEGTSEECTIDPHDLQGIPFIMPDGAWYMNRRIRGIMDEAGVHFDIAATCCDIPTMIDLVKRGLGVTVIPSSHFVREREEALACYRIKGHSEMHELYYVRKRGHIANGDELDFVRILKEAIPAFRGSYYT